MFQPCKSLQTLVSICSRKKTAIHYYLPPWSLTVTKPFLGYNIVYNIIYITWMYITWINSDAYGLSSTWKIPFDQQATENNLAWISCQWRKGFRYILWWMAEQRSAQKRNGCLSLLTQTSVAGEVVFS